MAKLSIGDIKKSIDLGKRASAPITLKEVQVKATPITKGVDTYNINGANVSHDDLVNNSPANMRTDMHNYLTSFRVLDGGKQTVAPQGDVINRRYVLNSAGTKNAMYDIASKLAQNFGKK